MKLITHNILGENRGRKRLFLEGQRLAPLGFGIGSQVYLEPGYRRVTLRTHRTEATTASYTVSRRLAAGASRPLLDIESNISLAALSDFTELKMVGTTGSLIVTPSVRGFAIGRSRRTEVPFRVVELFCGGGTLSSSLRDSEDFRVVAGVEKECRFADVWHQNHPDATLIQSDLRMVNALEIPPHDILVAGIPCTDHSPMGRAKKSLKGKAETGGAGDLFMDVLAIVRQHLPLACIFENVVNFGQSLAGLTVKNCLTHMGYHLTEEIIRPHAEWGEPSDRQRWVLVASLRPGFMIQKPMTPFNRVAADFLDSADPIRDEADANHIAKTIAGLRVHNARHKAQGHGFGFSTINGTETKIPTIVRSYHKINCGPFVETPYGPRMLRQAEIERIQGHCHPTGAKE